METLYLDSGMCDSDSKYINIETSLLYLASIMYDFPGKYKYRNLSSGPGTPQSDVPAV